MSETRLTGAEKRALILWIIAGIIGVVVAQKYFFQAFPEAAVDFKVSRAEAQNRAKAFLALLRENVDGYQSTVVFEVDDNAKTYLERELGLKQANQMMSSEVSIWYWNVRFFKPEQEEEYLVRISPAGRVVAYEHKIPEARGAKSFRREEALAAAQKYLEEKTHTDLAKWDFLSEEANSETKPNRIDWSFTWEEKGFKAKDAPYRLTVDVQGDKIGGSQEFLRVPEQWTRDYQRLRSSNELYGQIALVPYGFLLGGALWLGVSLWRQGKTRWAPAFKVGGLIAILFFLMQVNQWDLLRAGYDTHASYASFVTRTLVSLVLGAIGTGLMVVLVLPGGEPLYREAQPDKLRLDRAITLRGIRSKEVFCSSVVGLSMAAAHIGFIVLFYMVGSRLGVWAPQDLNYSDAVNTSFPWIAGVAIGLMAATSEEFLFRLFAIPFLRKLTGSRILAIILPAFFWSFLHSNYPQEPGYIRGIEVGLIGLLAGVVMLRWGIVATLTWHYTVDASLVGMLLIRSDNLYYRVSGIVVGLAALAPLAYSGISYLGRGTFEDVDDLLNRAVPATGIEVSQKASEAATAIKTKRYDGLQVGTIGFLGLCLLLGGSAGWTLKREHVGDYLRLAVDARSATSKADAVLKEHGVDPKTYHHVAMLVNVTDPITNEYLRRTMSVAEINRIYAGPVPGVLWRVRYFRDSQAEEYAVVIKPDASLHAFRHTLADAAPGATLSKEEALPTAEKFLSEQKKIDLSNWRLVDATSDKRPHRTDHTLTWQQNTPLDTTGGSTKDAADHAYARMDVQILGDEPANYRTYIKIPEEFARRQEAQNLSRTVFAICKWTLVLGWFVALLVFFFRGLKRQPVYVPWRRLVLWGLAGTLAFCVNFLLGRFLPPLLAGYRTAMPLKIYYASIAVGIFLGGALILGGITLLFGLAWNFAARAFGEERVPTWLGMPPAYYRDAFWIAIGGTAAWIAVRQILDAVMSRIPAHHRFLPMHFGDFFDAIYPAVAVICDALLSALVITGCIALVSAFLGAELRVRWLRLVLFVAAAAALVSDWGSPLDFAKQFVAAAALLLVLAYGIRQVARFNVLGWFLVIASLAMVSGAAELLKQPSAFYRTQGFVVIGALVLLLALALLASRGPTSSGTGESTTV